ncbi:tetrapyrrole (Corrin/Porphyrin) Methylases family protein [Mycobacterium kansasii]|uniref:Tetrapyrrole (Corrin/Porphyrin) Methylases family protein n=1 Tax=Mycobacterium kansasii TaxID=1768 RepID=A0A1V3XL79_MYCKA|nr:tetrapyrrole (Corrin/Porphyrin) Methylases family protein [Mycobacterium kansasii]
MGRHIHVIGIGAGDPDYLTVQAINALNDAQVFFAMDKGETKSDLVALRRAICERFIREPGYRFVELPDPERATDTDYRKAVFDWHAARARIWSAAIAAELGPDGVGAFLAWAIRRCTTARCAFWKRCLPRSTSAMTSSRESPRFRR